MRANNFVTAIVLVVSSGQENNYVDLGKSSFQRHQRLDRSSVRWMDQSCTGQMEVEEASHSLSCRSCSVTRMNLFRPVLRVCFVSRLFVPSTCVPSRRFYMPHTLDNYKIEFVAARKGWRWEHVFRIPIRPGHGNFRDPRPWLRAGSVADAEVVRESAKFQRSFRRTKWNYSNFPPNSFSSFTLSFKSWYSWCRTLGWKE